MWAKSRPKSCNLNTQFLLFFFFFFIGKLCMHLTGLEPTISPNEL